MQAFVEFVLVDGNVISMANLVSFFGFCIVFGGIVMIAQACMRSGSIR